MAHYLLSFFLLFPFYNLSHGSLNYHQTKFTINDGLNYNEVLSITKDKYGRLWIGTQNGLNMYDGIHFENYLADGKSKHQGLITDRIIKTLFADNEGNLWIKQFGPHAHVYDFVKGTISSFMIFDYNKTPWAMVNCFFEDSKDNCWMGTTDGLMLLDKSSLQSRIIKVSMNGKLTDFSYYVNSIYEDSDSKLWIGTDQGLFLLIEEKDNYTAVEFIHQADRPNSLSDNNITCMIEGSDKFLYIGTHFGLNRLNIDDLDKSTNPIFQKFYKRDSDEFSLSGNSIFSMTKDDKNRIILRTGVAVDYMITDSEPIFNHIYYSKEYNEKKDVDFLRSLYYDSDGIIWYGTDEGLFKNIISEHFITYAKKPDNSAGKIKSFDIFVDQSGILYIIGDDSGILTIDTHNKSLSQNPKNLYFDNEIQHAHTIEEDKNGTIWIGGTSLIEMNPSKEKAITIHSLDSLLVNDQYIQDIYNINNELLFMNILGNSGHTSYIFHRNEKRFYKFILDGIPNEMYLINKIPDSEKIILQSYWGAYEIDSIHIDPEKAVVEQKSFRKLFNVNDLGNISGKLIISKVNEGLMYVSTLGSGLYKFTPKHKYIRSGRSRFTTSSGQYVRENFTIDDGLAHNYIYDLFEDHSGNIWLTTSNGLSRFNPEENKFHNYYHEDGISDNNFNWGLFREETSGYVYLSTVNGITAFNPDHMIEKVAVKKVVISELSINGKIADPRDMEILSQSIMSTKQLQLQHKQNFISLKFFVPNYRNTNRNFYSYKMEGLAEDWSEPSSNNFASFTDLRPGKYTFKVKSFLDDLENSEETSLVIHISPPFWLRWWFILTLVLLFALAIRYYVRLRTQILKKKNIDLERIVQMKTEQILSQREEIDLAKNRFFANISHEFRTPLTLIKGSTDQLFKRSKSNENTRFLSTIKNSSNHLLKLVNEILELSRLEAGKYVFNPKRNNIIATSRTVWGFYLSETERRKIKYLMDVPCEELHCYYDEDIVQKVLHNLISNAIKFSSDGGEISLSLLVDKSEAEDLEKITFIITDNGLGIPENNIGEIFNRFYQADNTNERISTGTGIGLALVKELIDLHNGEIIVQSVPGLETSFRVTIPCEIPDMETIEAGDDSGSADYQIYTQHVESVPETDREDLPDYVSQKNKQLVLVIEDNNDLRKYITSLLNELFKVISEPNGAIGFETAKQKLPDLIISDIMMPEMDGVELCKKLKIHQATNHIPIILLTAKADKQSKLEGLEAWADDYITKPFDSDELLTRVNNLIRQRQELRKHFEKKMLLENNVTETNFPQYRMLREIIQIYDQHLSEAEVSVDILCDKLNLSKSQLYRKIRSVTGSTPNELLRMIRMKRAAQLLRKGELNITQIMHEVGFRNLSHFAASFKKFYGVNPSDYRK